ncbi:hypothetical protein A3A20_01695 [Candidatus Wolfebacteria bacterium RIFCSPLOWO2_01_FULL_45_19]|uniref:Predicted 3'-5' exonuclease PolB-like domain-containing protein n=1 Tax=Candidatus Wolfebacteria bacterium RIFCSPLOWO2_01_FULL_45_19 TaxID=1802557 RepID=A0A1F8DSL8_9BACT|nr:MAG: hypothetical protein UX23_C0002G0044 [Parcubacteria group bacterium GW2011_GWB1_45_9]OGM91633.1 MAG: hypothetical protein A3A20_01695 [Candidatus Wolfebacteria bacterium RIFCSPLOWO2_01_FULL_45_19]
MSTQKLILDVETVGVDFETLDAVSQKQMLRYFERYADSSEEVETAKDSLGLWPLTGEVVAIGILNPDTNKGAVYINAKGEDLPEELEPGVVIETGDETTILKKWWETANAYNYLITYNGRGFDIPFLMVRSAINGIRPTKNFLSNRYLTSQQYGAIHVDLQDQMTFYGAMRKNFSLHFWSRAFDIKSPKEEGVSGEDVKGLYKDKKFLEIARYNLGDLKATKELYLKWNQYLNI